MEPLEPITQCLELYSLKITVSMCGVLIINDAQMGALVRKLKKLRYIQIGAESEEWERETETQSDLSLCSLDSLALHCPNIQYIGLMIVNFQVPSPYRIYSPFKNEMTSEFFHSPLEMTQAFPFARHLSALCRPTSRRPPVVVRCESKEWNAVRETVNMLHSVLEVERRRIKSNAEILNHWVWGA